MKTKILAAILSAGLLLTACSTSGGASSSNQREGERTLTLSDQEIKLDGQTLSQDGEGAVTLSHDIVYYHDNTGEDYGEGAQADMHTQEEADAHTVVTIREAGTYRVSGTLSAGQLAIDLGSEAKRDPESVVTLVLDGVDITCTVAPAVIFYNVYECDGAFYSKMSMNINGETEGTGTLSIVADNEGLDSELHLTINGGQINIQAQNDGINTNEDNVSVTTINGGALQINAGLGEEGDGIDSNGHIVINGGAVCSMASDHSPDGGLDADGEILINGGQVAALGVRNDAVSSDSKQLYIELSFASALPAGASVELEGTSLSFTLEKGAQSILYSAPELEKDVSYTLKVDGAVQQYTGHTSGGFGGGQPGGMDVQPPEGMELPGPQPPESQEPPQRPENGGEPPQMPDGQQPPELPEGQNHPQPPQGGPGQFHIDGEQGEPSADFTLTDSVRSFSGIAEQKQQSAGKA